MASQCADRTAHHRGCRRSRLQRSRDAIEQASQSPVQEDRQERHKGRNRLAEFLVQGIRNGTKEHDDVRQKQNQYLGKLFDARTFQVHSRKVANLVLVEVCHSKGNDNTCQHKRADHLRICHYFNHGGVSSKHDPLLA